MSNANDDFLVLHEIVKAAKKNLSPEIWDYLVGGAETETTLKRNRQAIDSLAFRPRVLRDVSKVDCSTTLLGEKLRIPVFLAPIGSLQDLEPGGGATAARAANRFGTACMLSSRTEPGLEALTGAMTRRNSVTAGSAASLTIHHLTRRTAKRSVSSWISV